MSLDQKAPILNLAQVGHFYIGANTSAADLSFALSKRFSAALYAAENPVQNLCFNCRPNVRLRASYAMSLEGPPNRTISAGS